MKNLLTIKYWFSVNPGSLNSSGLNLLIIIIALLFLISIVSISIYNFSIANFIIGLLFLFFHYENIPFFTARFWLAVWAIGLVVWLAFIGKKIKKIPEKRKEIEKEQEKKKYLP